MLTDEMLAEGWIEHDGGPCPIDPEMIVHMFMRVDSGALSAGRRTRDFEEHSWPAGALEWGHRDCSGDLLAYRPESHPNAS